MCRPINSSPLILLSGVESSPIRIVFLPPLRVASYRRFLPPLYNVLQDQTPPLSSRAVRNLSFFLLPQSCCKGFFFPFLFLPFFFFFSIGRADKCPSPPFSEHESGIHLLPLLIIASIPKRCPLFPSLRSEVRNLSGPHHPLSPARKLSAVFFFLFFPNDFFPDHVFDRTKLPYFLKL